MQPTRRHFSPSTLGSPFRFVEQDTEQNSEKDLIMIFNNLKNSFVSAAAFLVLAGTAVPVLAAPVKNIVLVHGAFVDGSGWKPVYDILVKDGYSVTVVQHPLTSLEEDVAATKRILDRQPGPCILVGHSYGGAVITEAGTDFHVAALVYIAAHAPEQGETERANSNKVEAEGASHAVYISHAKEVAALIEEAANQAPVAAK